MQAPDYVVPYIEQNGHRYTQLADKIWSLAEVHYKEFRSAELHIEMLEAAGFTVARGVAGMPTAFIAQAGRGGSVIAILGEYDALPGLSQESGAMICMPSSEIGNGNGHGCGHHLLGSAAHLAAVAVKEALDRSGEPGTVRFYGCPAEESGSGKTFMVRAGLFDDVDAAVSWHPAVVSRVVEESTLANIQVSFRFTGKAAHAAVSPHLGRSALDAVELTNVGVNYLREHMLPDARVHYAITKTGGDAPNIVQANAEVLYVVRAPLSGQVAELYERVCNVARGAALMTGCKLDIVFEKAVSNLVPNTTLSRVMDHRLRELGGASFDADDMSLAEQVQERALTREDIESAGRPLAHVWREPKPLFDGILPFDPNREAVLYGSTDVGDVSWMTPTVQCVTACYAFGTGLHSWQSVAQGKSSIAHKGMLLAAKAMAATAMDLFGSPQTLAEARAELQNRLRGDVYVCPIPANVMPSLGVVDK